MATKKKTRAESSGSSAKPGEAQVIQGFTRFVVPPTPVPVEPVPVPIEPTPVPVVPVPVPTFKCAACGETMPSAPQAHRCRLCGAVKTVNAVSGNEIWMRNGRIIVAYQDSRAAYLTMAQRYGIPREQWPPEFLDG